MKSGDIGTLSEHRVPLLRRSSAERHPRFPSFPRSAWERTGRDAPRRPLRRGASEEPRSHAERGNQNVRNHWLSVLLFVLFAGTTGRVLAEPPAALLDAESQRIAVINKAKNSVLAIFLTSGQGGGSGVVISPDGYALTNFHVALPCGKAMLCGMADGKTYDAVLVGLDPTGDVALVKLFGRDDFPYAELGDSDKTRVGDWVFVMGNPFLLATDFQPTVTYGIISAMHRYQKPADKREMLEYTDCLQTDASINPGNSGGPLFDADGRVIGINGRGSFEKRGRVNVGAAYAISINQIKNFLGVLRGGRIADHATLGAEVASDEGGRPVVTEILEISDAYRRGLRTDDEIVSFAGRSIATANAFKNILGTLPKGWRVPLSYRHEGKQNDVLVRLAGAHSESDLVEMAGGRTPNPPMPIPESDKKPKKPAPPGHDGRKPAKKPAAKPAKVELPLPEVVTKHFVEKRGFANYYYNKLNQERIWQAWNSRAKLGGGPWTLAGPLEKGRFRFQITDQGASLQLPSGEQHWTAGDNPAVSLAPPDSGGLFAALFLWRRLATEGLAHFGEIRYAGAAPLIGHAGLVDVLTGTHKGVECRFYFDAVEGDLLAIEFFPDENSDPCEVYFSDFRQMHGRVIPGRVAVHFGDKPYALFKIDEFGVDKRERGRKDAK
jgi:serine protease Do